MTVEEAGERFSALEVVEWMAFFTIQKKELDRASKKKASPSAED